MTKSFKNAIASSIPKVFPENVNITSVKEAGGAKVYNKRLKTSGVDVNWELQVIIQDVVNTESTEDAATDSGIDSMANEFLAIIDESLNDADDPDEFQKPLKKKRWQSMLLLQI